MDSIKQDQKVIEGLKKVKKLYHQALNLSIAEEQKVALEQIRLFCSRNEELEPVKKACQKVLLKSNLNTVSSNLILEAIELSPKEYISFFPTHPFDVDLIVFNSYYLKIKKIFDELLSFEHPRNEKFILEKLHRCVYNFFVDNKNFKGTDPYYKRNYQHFQRDQNSWLEFLDDEYDSFIKFFSEPA